MEPSASPSVHTYVSMEGEETEGEVLNKDDGGGGGRQRSAAHIRTLRLRPNHKCISPGLKTTSSPSIGLTDKTNEKPMQKQDPEKKR